LQKKKRPRGSLSERKWGKKGKKDGNVIFPFEEGGGGKGSLFAEEGWGRSQVINLDGKKEGIKGKGGNKNQPWMWGKKKEKNEFFEKGSPREKTAIERGNLSHLL